MVVLILEKSTRSGVGQVDWVRHLLKTLRRRLGAKAQKRLAESVQTGP